MKRNLNVIIGGLLLLISLAMLCSCTAYRERRCRALNCCPTVKDSTAITYKDSTYLVPIEYAIQSDSAWMQSIFECDSLRHVILKESRVTNGKYVKLLQDIQNGVYSVTAYIPARTDTIYKPVTSYIKSVSRHQVVIKEVNRLKWWQTTLMFCGGAFIVGIIVLIVLLILGRRR